MLGPTERVALTPNCALEFVDSRFYTGSKSKARAYRVYRQGHAVNTEQVAPREELSPLEDLDNRPRFASAWGER